MKILITTEWYTPIINGVVNSTVILQRELQKEGHDVRILTLSDRMHSYHEGNVTYIAAVNVGKIYPDARIALLHRNGLIKKIIDWCPDIIHSQCEFSTFIIACKIAKKVHIPIIHTYHTIYEDYTHYFFPNKKAGKAIAAILTKRAIKHTDYVIAPTDKVRDILIGYGVCQKIMVVPTGIDLQKFNMTRDEEKLKQLRKEIGIPEGNKVVVTVGRLAKEKNLDEIILFISRLNNCKITLLVVGDGPYRTSLECYAQEMNICRQTIFTGMVASEQVADYYKLGDVFVCASNSEAQGLTYLEALAVGVPALCKKDPCLDDIIIDGVNGWQYTSYQDFLEKLTILLDQEVIHDKLSQNAHECVVMEHSSNVFARKVSQLYENLLI